MKVSAALIVCLVALAACFVSVPVMAATLGGWYAYWGAMVVSAVWAGVLLWLKLTKYWEEDD